VMLDGLDSQQLIFVSFAKIDQNDIRFNGCKILSNSNWNNLQ